MSKKQLNQVFQDGVQKGKTLAFMHTETNNLFFNMSVENCEGNFQLLEKWLSGVHKDLRRGNKTYQKYPDQLGLMAFSSGNDSLAILCFVPNELLETLTPVEWLQNVVNQEGEKVSNNLVKFEMKADPSQNRYPLKDRDMYCSKSFGFLRSKGLMNDEESEEEVDYSAFCDL